MAAPVAKKKQWGSYPKSVQGYGEQCQESQAHWPAQPFKGQSSLSSQMHCATTFVDWTSTKFIIYWVCYVFLQQGLNIKSTESTYRYDMEDKDETSYTHFYIPVLYNLLCQSCEVIDDHESFAIKSYQ
jgi:hypothetical protein